MADRCFALIPCAGRGSRAGTAGPKQYEPLLGQPLVLHTLAAWVAVPRLAGLLLVVAADDRFWQHRTLPARCRVASCGGPTRAASVRAGLDALGDSGADDEDWVLVHDAARCLITPALIDRLIDACAGDPVGGLLALPLADTLKQSDPDGRVDATLPRDGRWLAQTPQMFRRGLLARALDAAGAQVTDEAAAVEALGLRPRLVTGDAANMKVTWPGDFALARAILQSRA